MSFVRCLPLLICLSLLVHSGAVADERILQFLEDRYTHALMRQVGPEANDAPAALGRADCVERRVLNRHQRNEARRLGRIFERSGIHIDLLATSRWCRAIETAQLLKLRPVREEGALDALSAAPSDQSAEIAPILDLLDGLRSTETALLVTHASNIKALTGRRTQPGEVIIFRLRPGEDLVVWGSYRLD